MATRRKKVWIAAGILASFFLMGLASILVYVHTDHAGQQIQALINRRIPGQIIFKDYEPALHKGEMAMGNILVKDPEGHTVGSVDEFLLKISWSPLFAGNVVIDRLFIKNPDIKLMMDPDGNINLLRAFVLPKSKEETRPQKSADEKPSLNLVIKDFTLENGAILFENTSKGFQASLNGIQINSSGDLHEQSWKLALSASRGTLETPERKVQLDLLAFSGMMKEEKVSEFELKVKTASSNLAVVASAQNIFSDPLVDLNMDFKINLPELGEALFWGSGYTGDISGNLSATGNISNPDANLDMTYLGGKLADTHIDKIKLQAILQDRIFELSPVQIHPASGHITGHLKSNLQQVFPEGFLSKPNSFEHLTYDIYLMIHKTDLKELFGQTYDSRGILEGSFAAKGNGIASEDAVADIFLELNGSGVSTGTISPIDIRVKSEGSLSEGNANIKDLNVSAGPTKIQGKGHLNIISKSIHATIEAVSKDMEATLAPMGIKGVKGAFDFEATASGTLEQPMFELLLKGDDIHLENMAIGDIDLSAKLSEGNLLIQRSVITNQNSSLEFSGTLDIFEKDHLKLLDDPAINMTLTAAPLNLKDFTDQADAKISMNAIIQGTLKHLKGHYEIQAEKIETEFQNLDRIYAKGNLIDNKIHFEPLQIVFSPGQSIDGSGWVSTDKMFNMKMVSDGIFLNQIDKIREQNMAEGILLLDFTAEGDFDNPKVKGKITSKDLSVNQKELGNIHMDIILSDYLVELNGRLNFDFSASYHLRQQDFKINLLFDDADLAPYFTMTGLTDFSGILSGKMHASGNASNFHEIAGTGQFSLLNLFIKEQELVYAENFSVTLENQQILIPDLDLRILESGNLIIDAMAGFEGPLQVSAEGKFPLEGLQWVTQSLPDISGTMQISAQVEGTVDQPNIHGEILMDQIGFTLPQLYQKLHSIKGRIVFTPEVLNFKKIQGNLDAGRFELDGQVALQNFSPQHLKLDLALRSLPVKVPDTLNVLLQSDLRLSGTPEKAILGGEVTILEGVYYKDVNLSLVQGIAQRKRQVAPQKPQKPDPMLQNLHLDIVVKRRSPFYVDNNLAYLDINPDIRIAGNAQQPVVEGRTTIESGTIQYQRKTFAVQKGIIDFINPYELEPTVDIESTIKIRKWLITLTVSGTPDNLVVTLKSDPPEEDGDIISLLVLGRTTRELIAREGGSSRSSEQMVAELIATTFGEDIKQMTGLDFLEVDTDSDDESNNESEGVRVTVGKRLSERLAVKYSVDSRTGEMIQRAISEYRLLENIILSAFQDTSGIFGGEIQYRLEFR